MDKFEVGQRYIVARMDEKPETVVIASRSVKKAKLEDGREVKILLGVNPTGGDEEVIRLNEVGVVAEGIVRVCHRIGD